MKIIDHVNISLSHISHICGISNIFPIGPFIPLLINTRD